MHFGRSGLSSPGTFPRKRRCLSPVSPAGDGHCGSQALPAQLAETTVGEWVHRLLPPAGMRLVYIGPQGRTPWIPGVSVEARPLLSDVEGEAELVVIDPGGVAAARARFPRARVLARVARREDVAAALTIADDAVVDDEPG